MGIVAYKNRNTDQVVAFPAENPRLEALKEWERTDEPLATTVADHHDRAAAERASIEGAAAIRLDTAAGAAVAGIAGAKAVNEAAGGPGQSQPLPTLSTGSGGETQSLVALLDKEDDARKAPMTSKEEVKARHDAELEDPPRTGVLKRAHDDQHAGITPGGRTRIKAAGDRAVHGDTDKPATKTGTSAKTAAAAKTGDDTATKGGDKAAGGPVVTAGADGKRAAKQ